MFSNKTQLQALLANKLEQTKQATLLASPLNQSVACICLACTLIDMLSCSTLRQWRSLQMKVMATKCS